MCMKEVMNNDRIIKTNLSLCTFLLTVSSRFSKMCMKEVVNNDTTIKSNLLGLQGTVDRGVVYLCIQATLRFIKINFHSIIQHFLLKSNVDEVLIWL